MTVGVLGLGLIGGSMVKAFARAGHRVLAWDTNADSMEFSMISGAVADVLNENTVGSCDLILLCIFPDGSADWLEKHAPFVSKDTLVMDCCGTKARICARCFPIAEKYGFTYVGGHPMAGTQFSGFKHSRASMFVGAPMVLVPPKYDDIALLQRVKDMLEPCKFGSFSVSTAEEHDRTIAFSSQMVHLISNAYIKSPTATNHKGVSAGSYRDMTRVARLNPVMWAELFLENKENVLNEMDQFLTSLQAYRIAIAEDDKETLTALLEEGRARKELVDG